MIVGMHTAEDKVNVVLKAPKDLAFSIDIKRERVRNRKFNVVGMVEQIIFENDKDCSLKSPEALRVGRRLYWPENGPLIAKTIPEEDLVFTRPLVLPLPEVPDPLDARRRNPFRVDQDGHSNLKPGQNPIEARRIPQKIERIASAKFRNFLVFHPVAQIILLMPVKGKLVFGSFGSHRQPLSSLTGFDGRKMALLIDPYNGEAFFSGGRYAFDIRG